jgi:hypothetical protein
VTGGLPPREPPSTGTETEHLPGALDRLRTTFRREADGLDADDHEWPFTSAADDDSEELYATSDDAVERSRGRIAAALADGGLDQLVHVSAPDGRRASLRRLLCDLLEEYGRHTGHADLLREAVDGRVGEDPPEDWRPATGRYRP